VNRARWQELAARYGRLRLAVVGDFCLDRYLEIDPERGEISIETGLPVHNVVHVRSQPGAAGTILNNLVALGVGEVYPVGFCGEDGEGYELRRALAARRGVQLDHFLETDLRRTFTYCKPLLIRRGQAPQELNRLDSKNWLPTPSALQERLIASVRALAPLVDAIILMDQVDLPETGVVTPALLAAIDGLSRACPRRLILADSRRGLRGYPALCLKMNAAELATLTHTPPHAPLEEIRRQAVTLARANQRMVFVTLSERGILAAAPDGASAHTEALPLRGEIDIVGAGDSVTANLTSALAAGATMAEAVIAANVAASVVLHQLGTTGTATAEQVAGLL
jgi:rfaE bifunctional protein kinase chain/domain